MYIPETVKCDVCGAILTVSNGWLSVTFHSEMPKELGIREFDISLKEMPAVCGESCLHTFISQNLKRLKE